MLLERYFTTNLLGHARHNDFIKGVYKSSSSLDECKLLQISMDWPSMNWKFYKYLELNRDQNGYPMLIDIGSCGLYTIDGGVKRGVEKTEYVSYISLKFGMWVIGYKWYVLIICNMMQYAV